MTRGKTVKEKKGLFSIVFKLRLKREVTFQRRETFTRLLQSPSNVEFAEVEIWAEYSKVGNRM